MGELLITALEMKAQVKMLLALPFCFLLLMESLNIFVPKGSRLKKPI